MIKERQLRVSNEIREAETIKEEVERQLRVSNEIREAEKKILINEIEKHTEIKKRLKNLQNGIEEVLTQNLPFHVEKRLKRVLQDSRANR